MEARVHDLETADMTEQADNEPIAESRAAKLCQILDAFLSGRLPKDDTMLEKLEEWFKTSWKNDEKILKEAKIIDHVNLLNKQETWNQHAAAFYLKLLSHVSLDHSEDLSVAVWQMYADAPGKECWDRSAAVRCAWLSGLRNLLVVESQQNAVVNWIMDDDRMNTVLESVTDNSMFVSKAAIEFLAVLLCGFMNGTGGMESSEFTNRFWNVLHGTPINGSPRGYALLQIVENAIDLNPACLDDSAVRQKILDKIWSILDSKTVTTDAERNIVMSILDHMAKIISEEDVKKLKDLPEILFENGDIKAAMTMANWLLTNHGESVKNKESLLNILFVALMAPYSEISSTDFMESTPSASIISPQMYQQVLKKVKAFPGIFLHQLNLLQKYHEVKNIPVKTLRALEFVSSSIRFEGVDPHRPLVSSLGNKDKVMTTIFDTFTHISTSHPSNSYKPLMVRCIMSFSANLLKHKAVVVVQKSLKCMLAMLEFLLIGFDQKKEEFIRRSQDQAGVEDIVDDYDDCDDEADPGPMVEEAISVWSVTVAGLQRILCDSRWEVIDSAVETLTQVVKKLGDVSMVQRAFVVSRLGGFDSTVLSYLSHPESYVRATSLQCLDEMVNIKNIWEPFLETHPKEDVLEKVLHIIEEDSEAFPRRAAVSVLGTFFSADCYQENADTILNALCKASQDFDYEVRMNAVEFWSKLVMNSLDSTTSESDVVPDYAKSLFPTEPKRLKETPDETTNKFVSHVVKTGCLKSLLLCAQDCDKTVQNKACQILCKIRETLKQNTDSPEEEKLQPVQELLALDLEALLSLSQLSTDQYDLNPTALLDDILTSVKAPEPNLSDNEDNAIDCY